MGAPPKGLSMFGVPKAPVPAFVSTGVRAPWLKWLGRGHKNAPLLEGLGVGMSTRPFLCQSSILFGSFHTVLNMRGGGEEGG